MVSVARAFRRGDFSRDWQENLTSKEVSYKDWRILKRY